MVVLKCKMCGGDLNLTQDSPVATCEFCGSVQTVPNLDDEKKAKLFERAGKLLRNCEFDKAEGVFENIADEFGDEAEAYWGLVLCKYGIEYVDDPATGRKVPTCHRAGFESIMDDPDLEQALENADVMARRVYREEAKAIEELRKAIIEVSGKEEPYDIFICYKESDETGSRTIDSVLAQDLYEALTEKGYRVFFARITLEDKLGQEYEPYIFAALNSAKIMLAIGTDYEYYNAVWVKNEWSRFLKLMAADKSKHLIPCYKGIDAYDLPKEFVKLQAQDLGKMGATQDILHGVAKLLPKKQEVVKEVVVVPQTAGTTPSGQLKRGNLALEDGEWVNADHFFEEMLNQDPECDRAYIGKYLAAKNCRTLHECAQKLLKDAERRCENGKSRRTIDTGAGVQRCRAAISKYLIPHYLNEMDIERLYAFDGQYYSSSDIWEREKTAVLKEWDNDKFLQKAERFASEETAQELSAARTYLQNTLEQKLRASNEAEERQKQEWQTRYEEHLDEADRKAAQACWDADARRAQDYRKLCEDLERATDRKVLYDIAKGLEKLGTYQFAQEKLQLARNKINAIDEKCRKEEHLRKMREESEKREFEEHCARLDNKNERIWKILRVFLVLFLLPTLIAAIAVGVDGGEEVAPVVIAVALVTGGVNYLVAKRALARGQTEAAQSRAAATAKKVPIAMLVLWILCVAAIGGDSDEAATGALVGAFCELLSWLAIVVAMKCRHKKPELKSE